MKTQFGDVIGNDPLSQQWAIQPAFIDHPVLDATSNASSQRKRFDAF
jgi:hypothetical protein